MALLLPLASLLPIWPGKNFLRPDSHIRKKQVIISMVFGLLAISGAELGIICADSNCQYQRCGSLSAHFLLLGYPAGIIAGIIGGLGIFTVKNG